MAKGLREGHVQVAVYIDEQKKKKLQYYALLSDNSMSKLIDEGIDLIIEKLEHEYQGKKL